MKRFCLSIVLILSICCVLKAQQQKLTEKKTTTVHAQEMNTDYTIYVQLPKSYGKLMAKYPVILLFDAQDRTLFDYTSAAIDRLMFTSDIPEAIFIGIVQRDRSKELGAENETTSMPFLNFVKNDLIAYLKKNYAINDYYTLIGHSLGGQFVTNAMMVYPDIFKSVISISGALGFPADPLIYKRKVLNKLDSYVSGKTTHGSSQQKYYFSVGNEGFQDSGFIFGALTIDSLFKKYNPGFINWHFDELKGFNHMTTPLVSVPAGLAFVFHDWHFSESVAKDVLLDHKTDPLEALKRQKDNIIDSYGTDITLPYRVYTQFADYYLSNGQADKAKLLIEQIITLYPNEGESYDLMSEVLIKQGDKKGALAYLKTAESKTLSEKYKDRIAKLSSELAVQPAKSKK